MKIRCFGLIAFIFAIASLTSAQSNAAIRKVDFKNFNYGALCAGPHKFFSRPAKKLVLRHGHQQHGDELNYADLGSVDYVDLNKDGRDEAFVIVNGQTAGSSNSYLAAYVFSFERGRARQIWSKCEENSSAELKGRSIVFTSPEWLKNDAHCCFSYITTSTYGWKGSRVALLSSKRKKSGDEAAGGETIEQLAARVSAAYAAKDLASLDADKPYLSSFTLVVDDSLIDRTRSRRFTSMKQAERWMKRVIGDVNPNVGAFEKCEKGSCTFADQGLLHNNLYLQVIMYGHSKGRPYIKAMHFLDGD